MTKMSLLYLAATCTAARLVTPAYAFSTTGRVATAGRFAFSRPSSSSSSWRQSSSPLFMSTAASVPEEKSAQKVIKKKVPITLLSGFLGAGKTCTLQHLLENTDGIKIGVIVNDVASVNIDAKLVSGKQNNDGVVELQNGCACCSLADELLTGVDTLLGKNREFDAVVVELSGVADPVAIKSNWNNAKIQGHPVTDKADVSQVVTLVDASTFGTDWMTWDVAGERDGWVDPGDDCAAARNIPELLAEQVEAADIILINKVDLAGAAQVKVASSLAKTLNKDAVMEEVKYGRVAPHQILRELKNVEEEEDSHAHAHDAESCQETDCTDSSHSHSHDHAATDDASSCKEPDCTDPSHSHSHDHEEEGSCSDADCTDTSHSHEHSHASTSTDQLGIANFVYKADRPFNTRKLLTLLNQWPVPIKDELDMTLLKEAQEGGYEVEGRTQEASPFLGVLRSKGFCWFAPTRWSDPNEDVWRHDTAMYWSHAGKHFGISSAGKWWGTISRDKMKKYFQDDMGEYDRIMKEDFVTNEFGDRRQEIVFIGVGLKEEDITHALDQCLLTEKGMGRYRQELSNYLNAILTSPAGGAGLFDVGSVDHMDLGK